MANVTETKIHINFTRDIDSLDPSQAEYSDTLIYSVEEYQTLTQEQIDTAIQERVDMYIALMQYIKEQAEDVPVV